MNKTCCKFGKALSALGRAMIENPMTSHSPIAAISGVLMVLQFAQIINALDYTSSWVGNTASGADFKWVPDFIDAMVTDPDGTCYGWSGWDEGGRNQGYYKDGEVLGNSEETMNHNRSVNSMSAGGYTITLDPLPPPTDAIKNDTRIIQWGKITGNGKTISDPAIYPHAVCMGTGIYKDKLLVADWGASKQILVYDVSKNPPEIFDRAGAPGGISASFTSTFDQPVAKNSPVAFPAGEYAPGVYHPLKFWAVTGLGMDSQGRLFASTSENGCMIRCFKHDGENWILDWQVMGLHFIDCLSFDEATGALDVYGPQEHYKMDWSKKTPGSEWSLFGYTVNGSKYKNDARYLIDIKGGGEYGIASSIFRTIQGKRVVYTNGMTCNYQCAFRFLDGGDVAVPTAQLSRLNWLYWGGIVKLDWPPNIPFPQDDGNKSYFWNDLNGDGQYDRNEYVQPRYGYGQNSWVDKNGNQWDNGNHIVCRKMAGINKFGVPIYDDAHTEEYQISGLPGQPSRVMYQDEFDRVIVTVGGGNRDIAGASVHMIDNWSSGNRTAKSLNHTFQLDPCRDDDVRDDCALSAATVVDHYLLDAQYGTGAKVRIWDMDNNCASVGEFQPSGLGNLYTGLVDCAFTLFAYKRPTGEIIVFLENNAHASVIMYRWTPPGVTLLPEDKTPPAAVSGLAISGSGDKNVLQWTPGTEQKLTYCVYRSKTPDVTAKYSEKIAHALPLPPFDDIEIEPGTKYYYRVTAMDNFGNESAASDMVASDGTFALNNPRSARLSQVPHDFDFYTVQGRKISINCAAAMLQKTLKSGCWITATRGNSKSTRPVLVVR